MTEAGLGLSEWQESLVDSGLRVDAETEVRLVLCRRLLAENYPTLISSFGPMNNSRVRPPVLAFFDADDSAKMRIYGAVKGATAESYARVPNQMLMGGAWVAYNFFGDTIGLMIEKGRIAKIDEWAKYYQTSLDDFVKYSLIEELTHACILKYPLVKVKAEGAVPGSYGELVGRVAKILGVAEVSLDPAEFWVAFGINLIDPGLAAINKKALKGFLNYLAEIESGKREINVHYLRYAAEHLTTRAAFDLIGDRPVKEVFAESPEILTQPEKLIDNFVLPIKVIIEG